MEASQEQHRRRLGAYVRVSRIGGRAGEGYITLDQQRERIQQFADYLGVEIVAWFEDQDYSGGNTERPAFLDMIAKIESGELEGAAVVRIDRFSRDVADGAAMIDRITKANGMFASATEHMDVREPVGRYMVIQMLNNAELQLNMLKASWVDAKVRAVNRGAHIGPVPFGYLKVPKKASEAQAMGLPPEMWERSGVLIPHPEEAAVVTRCFEMRLGDAKYTEIADYLQQTFPRPEAWQGSWVKQMLKRRVYLGEVRYRSRVKGVADLINLKAHTPIVEHELFKAVQATHVAGVQRVADESFYLSTVIRCAHCRYAMGGFARGGSKGKTPVYRCISRGARCEHNPVITAAVIEAYVADEFWRYMDDESHEIVEVHDDIDMAALDKKVADAIEEEDRWFLDTDRRRELGDERFDRYGAARTQARVDAERERDEAARQNERHQARQVKATRGALDREQEMAMLRGAVEAVFVRRVTGSRKHSKVADRVKVVFKTGPERQHVVPTRSVSGPFPALDWD